MDINPDLRREIDVALLSQEEKNLMCETLEGLDNEAQTELSELSVQHPWLLSFLYVNYAAKRYALGKGSEDLLRKILTEEAEVLEAVAA